MVPERPRLSTQKRQPKSTSGRRIFLYAVCGDEHVARANASLRFLKKFTRESILVVTSHTSEPFWHDQVLNVPFERGLSDHQMSLMLKTSLHRLVNDPDMVGCYLDTDIIPLSSDIDTVFNIGHRPFAFAADHVELSRFSRWAVNCGCSVPRCNHLVEAIADTFDVTVDPDWQHWNGGVFVFTSAATPLLDCWNEFTRATFGNALWKTRDQGTLIASAWKLGLQKTPLLERRYNYLVDCYHGVPVESRVTLSNEDLPNDDTYSLRRRGTQTKPAALHFINGGMMRRGWKNWDEAAAELEKVTRPRGPLKPSKPGPLTEDNRVVHGLWIGNKLSRLELLRIHSFLRHGHQVHLWVYDDLDTPLPKDVVLQDAGTILPRSSIFRKRALDKESGVGRQSVGPFSDIFRYKLLYEKGGWWADMDMTCLQPLNFQSEYAIRPHRVGVVGNLMKAPAGSLLMKRAFERATSEADENTSWLLPNRLLSETVKELKLDCFAYPNICNADEWQYTVSPMILSAPPVPNSWHIIHWTSEMWRTLTTDAGMYKGKLYMPAVPDRDHPPVEGLLHRFYQEYGLLDAAPPAADSAEPGAMPAPAAILKPSQRQPVCLEPTEGGPINIMLPSMAVGGAERTVLETLQGLAARASSANLFITHRIEPRYELKNIGNTRVFELYGNDQESKMRQIALAVLASPTPMVFTHLVPRRKLEVLWNLGVSTVPVIHNSLPSWQDSPIAFDHPRVPFVVAVSDNVAQQLRDAGCVTPTMTVRHESQRWFFIDELKRFRAEVRARHNIPDSTLLIGMVGEFKSQKAYTRAVRVLAEVRKSLPAKLLILGGWDHEWGNGRVAYVAACRQAMELGVMPDLLTPGSLADVERYYAAFDIFLNTSVYEGLSISTLEASRAGCPIVSADAGGNHEGLGDDTVIIPDSSDIKSYVNGIETALAKAQRTVASRPPDHDLIPRLWRLLGNYSFGEPANGSDTCRPLFVTDNLNLGGAARSMVNLLCHLPPSLKPWLGVLNDTNHPAFLDDLEAASIPVFSFQPAKTYLDSVERILSMRQRLKANTIVFWNTDARVKLLMAKILPCKQVRLIDVSPGPWLFEDLNNNAGLQRRIAFSSSDYFARLDHFVAKYAEGGPPGIAVREGKVSIIPNGVPELPVSGRVAALPPGADPDLVIGTCCRILPSKRIEYLVDMMAELNRRLPGVTMILAGAANRRYERYQQTILERMRKASVNNLIFVGQQADVLPYLRAFRVFVMQGTDHGCPNASLEAMALGLPVVASRHGGTGEQVEDGVNGFLVSDNDPAEMAHRVRMLLTNRKMLQTFGRRSVIIADDKFSMDLMVKRYLEVLTPGREAASPLPFEQYGPTSIRLTKDSLTSSDAKESLHA